MNKYIAIIYKISMTILFWSSSILLFLIIAKKFILILSDPSLTQETLLTGDYSLFYTVGSLVEEGKIGVIYNAEAFANILFKDQGVNYPQLLTPYSYPPISLLIWKGMFNFPYPIGYIIWSVICSVAFIVSLKKSLPRKRDVFLVLASPFFLWAIMVGNVGILMTAILIWGYSLYRSGYYRSSGLVWGLLIIKPHVALALPIILIADKRWQTIIAGVFSALMLSVISYILYPEAWAVLIEKFSSNMITVFNSSETRLTKMPSFYSMMLFYGMSEYAAILIHSLFAILSIIAGWFAWRNTSDDIIRLIILITIPAMVSPYYFHNDLPGYALIFTLIFNRHKHDETLTLGWLILGALCFAAIFIYLEPILNFHACPPIFFGMLLYAWFLNFKENTTMHKSSGDEMLTHA